MHGLKPALILGFYAALKRRSSYYTLHQCSESAPPPKVYRRLKERFDRMTSEPVSPRAWSDVPFYMLAALAGMGTGWVDVAVNDLLFTALLVLAACMLLGLLRPHWPWRWVVVVVVFIPLAELAAYTILTVQPTRGQVYGSFLTALPGIAGAYGGSLMRGVIDNLRQGK
jgi:ABC-type multidrug transport system permease subunit